jgi:14-3-3 protein epsilon
MLDYIKKVVTGFDQELSIEERNLLSVAYKNSISSRRTAWRAISSIEQKEESKGSKHLPLIKLFKSKIEGELQKFCSDILKLLDSHLVPKATNAESKVFYLKMKGDYYRYISEYAANE